MFPDAEVCVVACRSETTPPPMYLEILLEKGGSQKFEVPVTPISSDMKPYLLPVASRTAPELGELRIYVSDGGLVSERFPAFFVNMESDSYMSVQVNLKDHGITRIPIGTYELRNSSHWVRGHFQPQTVKVPGEYVIELEHPLRECIVRVQDSAGRAFTNFRASIDAGGEVANIFAEERSDLRLWLPTGTARVSINVRGYPQVRKTALIGNAEGNEEPQLIEFRIEPESLAITGQR